MLDRENVDSAELNAWNVEFLQRITYLFGPQQGCWEQGHTKFMLERLQIERVVFVNGGPICIGGPGCITPGMRRLKTYVMEAGMYMLVDSSVESNVISWAGCHKSAYQTKLKGGFPIPPLWRPTDTYGKIMPPGSSHSCGKPTRHRGKLPPRSNQTANRRQSN